MATIHDVAKKAGVSVATVSRYFNKGYVSESSCNKIDNAIKELEYKVDAVARALTKKSSKAIGLIIPSITNPFFPEIAQVIEDRATLCGYKLVLCNANSYQKELDFINMLCENYADGIITATGSCSEIYMGLKMPVVSIDRKLSDTISHVDSDNYAGGIATVRHLHKCGCRNIIFLRSKEDYASLTDRQNGIIDEAQRLKMNLSTTIVGEEELNTELGHNLSKYDAAIGWNDITAIKILNYCYRNSIRVPEDLMVMGYDNIYMSSLINPMLTTISQNISKMGEAAINTMLYMIKEKNALHENSRLPVELVIRETTKIKK